MQTLRGILTNPVYTGEVYAGRLQEACGTGATATPRRVRPREDWITVASIPAIVTQEQFERVQDKLAQNRQFARRNNTAHAYLLRALVSCGVCGLACFGALPAIGSSLLLLSRQAVMLTSHRQTKCCPPAYIPAEQVERAGLGGFLPVADPAGGDPLCAGAGAWRTLAAPGSPGSPAGAAAGQVSVEQQIERLTEAYLAGVVGLEEYRRRRRDLEQKGTGLEAQCSNWRHRWTARARSRASA